jgi:hypothetical protein
MHATNQMTRTPGVDRPLQSIDLSLLELGKPFG